MKLNRLTVILVAMALMLCSFGVYAEDAQQTPDPAATPEAITFPGEPAGSGKPPLYIMLIDCGWTLYGDTEINGNSVVTSPGDPSGVILNMVEGALPALCEDNASICVYGYNDALLGNGVSPVPISDAAAVSAQVAALRAIPAGDRKSSLPQNALAGIVPIVTDYQSAYDCRLIVITGGAVNYANADRRSADLTAAPKPLETISSLLNGLATAGADVTVFGYDLAVSPRLNTGVEEAPELLISAESLPGISVLTDSSADANAVTLSRKVLDYFVKLCGKRLNANYTASALTALADADISAADSNDIAVIYNAAASSFSVCSGNDLAGITPAEGDYLLLYTSDLPPEPSVKLITSALDKDGDGVIDSSLNVGSAIEVEFEADVNISDYTFTVAGAPEGAHQGDVTVETNMETNSLSITGSKAGAVNLEIGLADGAAESAATIIINVSDYSLKWSYPDGAELHIGDGSPIVSCDPAHELDCTLEIVQTDENGVVTLIPYAAENISGNNYTLQIALSEPLKLQVTVTAKGNASRESRTFTVVYPVPEPEKNISLIAPYFSQQPGQQVQITDANGNPIRLSGFSFEHPALADVYFSDDGLTMYLTPTGSGSEDIVLTHKTTGQTCTIHLTVESLYSRPVFWVLAVAVPVCLIGFTTMLVMLIIKIKNRKY